MTSWNDCGEKRGECGTIGGWNRHEPSGTSAIFSLSSASVMQFQIALERVLNLIARIEMEFVAVLAPARDEGERLVVEPDLVRALSRFCEIFHDPAEIDVRHREHGAIADDGERVGLRNNWIHDRYPMLSSGLSLEA